MPAFLQICLLNCTLYSVYRGIYALQICQHIHKPQSSHKYDAVVLVINYLWGFVAQIVNTKPHNHCIPSVCVIIIMQLWAEDYENECRVWFNLDFLNPWESPITVRWPYARIKWPVNLPPLSAGREGVSSSKQGRSKDFKVSFNYRKWLNIN